MTDMKRRIAGLKGAIAQCRRAIDANKQDVAYGHKFEHYLAENEAKMARLQRKLQRARQGAK